MDSVNMSHHCKRPQYIELKQSRIGIVILGIWLHTKGGIFHSSVYLSVKLKAYHMPTVICFPCSLLSELFMVLHHVSHIIEVTLVSHMLTAVNPLRLNFSGEIYAYISYTKYTLHYLLTSMKLHKTL